MIQEPAKEESGVHNGAASGVAGLIANAAPHFSFMAATRHDPAVDLETGLLRRPSVDASFDSVAAGAEANAPGPTSVFCRRSERTSSAWFKTSERIPTVVLVTMRVRQMTVSAVLSEVNLTAVVRGIHGSFSKKNRVRGHSKFNLRNSVKNKFAVLMSTLIEVRFLEYFGVQVEFFRSIGRCRQG